VGVAFHGERRKQDDETSTDKKTMKYKDRDEGNHGEEDSSTRTDGSDCTEDGLKCCVQDLCAAGRAREITIICDMGGKCIKIERVSWAPYADGGGGVYRGFR
jgi:hypothetical protein